MTRILTCVHAGNQHIYIVVELDALSLTKMILRAYDPNNPGISAEGKTHFSMILAMKMMKIFITRPYNIIYHVSCHINVSGFMHGFDTAYVAF